MAGSSHLHCLTNPPLLRRHGPRTSARECCTGRGPGPCQVELSFIFSVLGSLDKSRGGEEDGILFKQKMACSSLLHCLTNPPLLWPRTGVRECCTGRGPGPCQVELSLFFSVLGSLHKSRGGEDAILLKQKMAGSSRLYCLTNPPLLLRHGPGTGARECCTGRGSSGC
jgi:hypothetical protein